MTTYAEWHEEEDRLDGEEWEALVDYLANEHKTPDSKYDPDIVAMFQDSWQGFWATFEDYVESIVRDLHDIPDYLNHHINWESLARDWRHDYWYSDNGHVFRYY